MKISYEYAKYIKKLAEFKEKDIREEIYEENGITQEENKEVFLILKDKFVKGIYSKRVNPIGAKLDEDKFNDISLKKQCDVILEVLKFTQQANYGADLEALGVKGSGVGIMKINKMISKQNEVLLINQSVLGIYEERVDLLTI